MATRSILDMSDEEIRAQLRQGTEGEIYSRDDWLGELDRRSRDRWTARSERLASIVAFATVVNVAVAVANLLATAT